MNNIISTMTVQGPVEPPPPPPPFEGGCGGGGAVTVIDVEAVTSNSPSLTVTWKVNVPEVALALLTVAVD